LPLKNLAAETLRKLCPNWHYAGDDRGVMNMVMIRL